MKKVIRLVICLAIVLTAAFAFATATGAQEDIAVTLDGQALTFDQNPVIVEGRTLVPLRGIFEAMGATVDWNDETRCVTAVKGDIGISLTIGDNILYKNGESITLDVPAQIVNSRTLVPARAVSESFGARVDWNSTSRNVIISTDPVLNAALAKMDNANEFVMTIETKLSYGEIPIDVKANVGIDMANEKFYMSCDMSAKLEKIQVTVVNGDGKTYFDEDGVVNVVDAENMVDNSVAKDGSAYVLESETDTERIYRALNVIFNGAAVEAKICIDKSTCDVTGIIFSKELLKGQGIEAAEDIRCTVAYDTGEVMQMWNKYNK